MQETAQFANAALSDAQLDRFLLRLYAEAQNGGERLRSLGGTLLVDCAEDFEVIARNPDIYQKNYGPLLAFGRSRLSTNGAEWEARRALTLSLYIDIARASNEAMIDAVFADRLDRIETPSFARVHKAFFESSTIMFHRAFGLDIDPSPIVQLQGPLRSAVRRMERIAFYGGTDEEVVSARAEARQVLSGFWAARQRLPWLSEILKALAQRGAGITGFSPIEEYFFNMLAGVETSAAGALWVVDRLGAHPDLQEMLSSELKTDWNAPKLTAFINETVRRFPPIPYVARRIARDTVLNGRHLAADTPILVSIIGLHHNPLHWSDPMTFDPDRAEFRDNTYHRYAYVPFITGPRVCGGAKLARAEMAAATKAFLQRFRSRKASPVAACSLALAMRPGFGEHAPAIHRLGAV